MGKVYTCVDKLASLDPEFKTARSLIKIGYLWGMILLVVGIILTFVLVGLALLVVAFILLIIGEIGLIVLSFKLNEKEKNTLYLVAGILFIIGIFIPIAGFIAWILLYVALEDSIRRAEIAPPVTTQPV